MTLGPGDPFRNVGGRGIKLKEMLDLAAHTSYTRSLVTSIFLGWRIVTKTL